MGSSSPRPLPGPAPEHATKEASARILLIRPDLAEPEEFIAEVVKETPFDAGFEEEDDLLGLS